MPRATVTDDGETPVIAGDANRKVLTIQNNNSALDIRFRYGGPVSLTDEAKRGLLLRSRGGTATLAVREGGTLATSEIYAVRADGQAASIDLDYDEEVVTP